jgi:hypothetical protein
MNVRLVPAPPFDFLIRCAWSTSFMVFLMMKWRAFSMNANSPNVTLSLLGSSNVDRLREIAQKSASQAVVNTFGGLQECQA